MDRLAGRVGTLRNFSHPHSLGLRAPKNVCLHTALDRNISRTEASTVPRSSHGVVDGAVRRLNHWLSFENGDSSKNFQGSDLSSSSWSQGQKRNLTIRVKKRASEEILEASEAGKALKQYLVLPPEEYSVLDPRYVQRNPCKGPTAFTVTIPLDELLGIDMTPLVSVRVHVDKDSHEVRFVVDGFTFGNPDIDKYADIRIQSTLYSTNNHGRFRRFSQLNNIRKRQRHESNAGRSHSQRDEVHAKGSSQQGNLPSGPSASDRISNRLADNDQSMYESILDNKTKAMGMSDGASKVSNSVIFDDAVQTETLSMLNEQKDMDASHDVNTFDLSTSGSEHDCFQLEQSKLEGKKVRLHCCVQLQLTTVIPPALSFIPNPVLGSVGRIVLRAVLNALLPNFLELASKDYQHWVSGDRTCHVGIGSLVRVS